MPLYRDDYLRNTDEPIVAQKRMEREPDSFRNALILAGTVGAFVITRRKIALTRTISDELKVLGKAKESFKKYMIGRVTLKKALWPRRYPSTLARWGEELIKPLPTAQEQLAMALRSYGKHAKGTQIPILPKIASIRAQKWTKLDTMWKGPFSAYISPKAIIGVGGLKTSKYGGIAAGGTLYQLGRTGRVVEQVRGIEVGLSSFEGRLEMLRRGMLEGRSYRNLKEFARNVRLPQKADILNEEKRIVLEKFLRARGANIDATLDLEKMMEQAKVFKAARPELKGILTPAKLFNREEGAIKKAYQQTVAKLMERELKSPSTKLAYKAYRAQVALGVGEPFARYGAGEMVPFNLQRIERTVRELTGWGVMRHPVSGMGFPVRPRRYIPPKLAIGGMRGGAPSGFFLTGAGGGAKRTGLHLLEGTFFGVSEEVIGMGISARGLGVTRALTKVLGAEKRSFAAYGMNRYVGGIGRVLGLGFTAYHGFKFINYLARQATGGWGVTDVAGKAYTGARELQQNLLDGLEVVEGARKMEKHFPGIIKSPLSYAARITAPLWMAAIGKKKWGDRGGKVGLALGVAFALITWGNVTQSPEELHRIYTGEQDIPIRKGRYWPFGRTPAAGGKIMYWRPHWYPLMRSKYKFQGQLWDSETEYWAQGSPLAPAMAPILQGKLWDPYYWEKKHYYDRPYMLTGEIFEPTMPFAWLGNMTLGQLMKPQRPMHSEYWGQPQEQTPERGMVPGAAAGLGMQALGEEAMLPNISPTDMRWRTTQGLYSMAEMMGLRGFMLNTFIENLTGRPDFLPEGPIVQSARRATGYEREYWDMNIGDPLMHTEFFRRLLPHRRRAIEEYNPIENQMPEWMPGSEYYIDFRHGDPFCLSADTLVEVFDGYKKASEVISGDIVKTHNGVFSRIERTIKRSILNKEQSFSVSVSGINEIFEFSENHPIFAIRRKMCSFGSSCICRKSVRNYNGFCDNHNCSNKFLNDSPEFIKIKDLNVGDVVVYPIDKEDKYLETIRYNFEFFDVDKHNPVNLSGELLLDNNLAWLLGVYTAEGSTAKRNNRPVRLIFSLNKDEYDFAKLIEEKITSIFDSYPKWIYRENSLELIYCDAKLARIFDQIIPGNLYNKRIPKVLYRATKDVVFSYMSGFIVGDGSLSKNNLVVECANEELSQDIFRLSSSVGIAINYIKRNNRNSFGFSIHSFNIRNCDLSMLVNKVPSVEFDRQPAIDSWSDDMYIYRLVVAKEEIDLKEVYGFEVNGNDSSFCVFGFATHNTKIEMGEARLPGPGYEALHRLHSGVPEVYDAVDRFMILSDVAPYSDQYKQYRALATMMTRGDDRWSAQVEQHIQQRSATQKEYDFLELEPPEDVTGLPRVASAAWRRGLAAVTSFPSPHEMVPFMPTISKVLPYKTAIGAYRDYRIYGSEFTSWGHPGRDFIAPWINKMRGKAAGIFGSSIIPDSEMRRREYEDYFDKLKYVKNMNLASIATQHGERGLVNKFRSEARRTMAGVNMRGAWPTIYGAMPKRERSFFDAFVNAREEDREEILAMVPDQMQKLYQSQWNIKDKKDGLSPGYNVDWTISRDTVDYFKTHHLPPAEWAGWHPDVNLSDVQLKVVKNEGMDIHQFNLWESRERAMARRPYVPTIKDIEAPSVDLSVLQNALYGELENSGFQNSKIYITRTPANRNSVRMRFKIKRNRRRQYDNAMAGMI